MEETALTVVRCFEEVGVEWCLVGAHAYGVYVEPRATTDFDFVVDDRRLQRLLTTLERELGDLGQMDIGAAVRLTACSVDLIRASQDELFRDALTYRRTVAGWQVPRIEVLIVLKFLSSTSRWRGTDRRRQDMLDLVRLYRSVDADSIDRELLLGLAAKVYPGAEVEFERLLEKVDGGEPITI